MRWAVTTPPSTAVLTWTQLKSHVRPGGLRDQVYILEDLLPSAYAYAERMLESALSAQTITAWYDIEDIGGLSSQESYNGNPCGGALRWSLPRGPVLSITSVTDASGNPVSYRLHTEGNADFIVPLQPLTSGQCPVTVVYQAGYETIPADILDKIRVHVATMYMVRENISNLATNPVHKIDDYYRFRGRGTVLA